MFNLKKSILVLMFSGFGLGTITNNVNAMPPLEKMLTSRTINIFLLDTIKLRLMLSGMSPEGITSLLRDGSRLTPLNKRMLRIIHTASHAQLPSQEETIEAIRERIKVTIGLDSQGKPHEDPIWDHMLEEAQRIDPAFLETIATDLHAVEASIDDETIFERLIEHQQEWVRNIRHDDLRNFILQQIRDQHKLVRTAPERVRDFCSILGEILTI